MRVLIGTCQIRSCSSVAGVLQRRRGFGGLRSRNHEECRSFEKDDFGCAARLSECGEMLAENHGIWDKRMHDARPGLFRFSKRRSKERYDIPYTDSRHICLFRRQ